MTSNIDKILDNLYIGNCGAAFDPDIIIKYKIMTIVNCTINNRKISNNIEYLHIPINDPPQDEDIHCVNSNFYLFVPFISNAIDEGKNVLVHSDMGYQRAPIIVAIYMMVKFGFSCQDVITFVKVKRPLSLNDNINYLQSLIFVQNQMEILDKLKQVQQTGPLINKQTKKKQQDILNQRAQQYQQQYQQQYNPMYNNMQQQQQQQQQQPLHQLLSQRKKIKARKKKKIKISVPNIIIFDTNEELINEAQRLEKYGLQAIHTDVEELVNNLQITALVSPANSFGFMNGGIDKKYMNMFMNIEQKIQNRIKDFGMKSTSDRSYIPIGSAITVPTHNSKCAYVICAPTMFLP